MALNFEQLMYELQFECLIFQLLSFCLGAVVISGQPVNKLKLLLLQAVALTAVLQIPNLYTKIIQLQERKVMLF